MSLMFVAACVGSPGEDGTGDELFDAELRTCAGCVDDSGACIEFPADDACGTGGVACVACDAGSSCSPEFECVDNAPESSMLPEQWYYLELLDARVSAVTTEGGGWDGGDNRPDPYYVLETADRSARMGWPDRRRDDTLEPVYDDLWMFSSAGIHHGFCPTEIASTFRVSMWDYDRDWFETGTQKGDDFMGECEFQLTADEIVSGQPVSISCARDPELERAGFTVRVRVVGEATGDGLYYEKIYDCGSGE